MGQTRRALAAIIRLLCAVVPLLCAPVLAAGPEFRLAFAESVRKEPYTGRVYVFFSRRENYEPRRGPDWFTPEPFIALDVKDWPAGEELVLNAETRGLLAFPKPLAELPVAGMRAQGVARFNPFERNVGTGTGNGYSDVATVGDDAKPKTALAIDKLVAVREFPENRWCKLLRVRSRLLSEFHGRDVFQQAAVLLPASYYDEPQRRYPAMFVVPGFGGTHFFGMRSEPIEEKNEKAVEFLRVTLDPSCPLGHHVFADSDNNGPVGEALVKELLPAFDEQFRSVAAPTARFLTGHSSGGWSTLWLQVAYSETFGGVWSTAPDPVDFRDFQRIDVYRRGENMYRDTAGERRPIARRGGKVALWYDDFVAMETVLGYGGQLHSFEAVFSPRGTDGQPRLLWSRTTGAIDAGTSEAWKRYDINLVLKERWPELGPKLAGKLHVFMGEEDTFYLEGATRLLKQTLTELKSDAVVELAPGRDHFTLYSAELTQRMRGEMVGAFLRVHGP